MKRIFISFAVFYILLLIKINPLQAQTCVYCTGSSVNSTSSSIGANNTLSGTYSAAMGRFLNTTSNQSIVIGSGHNASYPLVNNIEPFSDGLGLQKDGASARPIFLKGMDSWFAYNFIMNLNQL